MFFVFNFKLFYFCFIVEFKKFIKVIILMEKESGDFIVEKFYCFLNYCLF